MLTRIIIVIAIVIAIVFVPYFTGAILDVQFADKEAIPLFLVWFFGVAAIVFSFCVGAIIFSVCLRLYDYIVDGY